MLERQVASQDRREAAAAAKEAQVTAGHVVKTEAGTPM